MTLELHPGLRSTGSGGTREARWRRCPSSWQDLAGEGRKKGIPGGKKNISKGQEVGKRGLRGVQLEVQLSPAVPRGSDVGADAIQVLPARLRVSGLIQKTVST